MMSLTTLFLLYAGENHIKCIYRVNAVLNFAFHRGKYMYICYIIHREP